MCSSGSPTRSCSRLENPGKVRGARSKAGISVSLSHDSQDHLNGFYGNQPGWVQPTSAFRLPSVIASQSSCLQATMMHEQETAQEEKEAKCVPGRQEAPAERVLHRRRTLFGWTGACPVDSRCRDHHHVAVEVAISYQLSAWAMENPSRIKGLGVRGDSEAKLQWQNSTMILQTPISTLNVSRRGAALIAKG